MPTDQLKEDIIILKYYYPTAGVCNDMAEKWSIDTYDGEQAADDTGDEVLTGPGAYHGVVCAADGRPVVCRDNQTHLQEATNFRGQFTLEPVTRYDQVLVVIAYY